MSDASNWKLHCTLTWKTQTSKDQFNFYMKVIFLSSIWEPRPIPCVFNCNYPFLHLYQCLIENCNISRRKRISKKLRKLSQIWNTELYLQRKWINLYIPINCKRTKTLLLVQTILNKNRGTWVYDDNTRILISLGTSKDKTRTFWFILL